MARKNVLSPYKILSNQSLVADFQSPPTIIPYADNCAYQINITTIDSIGTFSVQGSLDYQVDTNGNVTNSGHWVTLSLAGGTPFANAANDNIIINLNQLPFNAIRLAYTAGTPGTGTCDAYVMTRQIGG